MSRMQDQDPEHQIDEEAIDGRVLPDEPILKTTNPYRDTPEYLCPHCANDITPSGSVWGEDTGDGTPEVVDQHIRQCDGLKRYHLGLQARRKTKARWLAEHRAE